VLDKQVKLTDMDAATGPVPGPDHPEVAAPGYVVLGMIGLGARSGYEIKQLVGQSIRFFWTISPVQIYPSLRQLAEAGFVTGRPEPRGRRPRQVYEITEAGRAALRQWLRRADPMPFELRDLGLVKLFFADALEPGEARDLLRAIRERSEERLVTLRAVEPTAHAVEAQGDPHPLLTLRMGIAVHQAMADVCRDFEDRQAGGPAGRGQTG
jgi:PadR family transcriptional regulator, regulatory protein AphA